MQPQDQVVGGTVLRIPAIQSPNFVEALSGWKIAIDGSAEFNNLTIRGTYYGTDYIISPSGIFFYSSTPANGNLVISLSQTAGTDSFSNGYPAGLQILNHGGANASGIALGFAGTQPLQYFLNSVANMQNDPAFLVNTSGAGAAEFASFVISGGEDATQKDYVAISFDSSSEDGSSHIAQLLDAYVDSAGASHPLILRGPGGTTIYAGALFAVQPGTGSSRANLAVGETWHTIGATGQPAFGAGFTSNVADQTPRFRLDGLAGGIVRLDGTVYTSAATAAGATMFTLPAGYRPQARKRFVGSTNASGYTTLGGSLFSVSTAGVVSCTPLCNAAGQQIVLDGASFPVD